MDKELQLITSILGSATAQTFEGITIHFGKIGRHEVYVAKCGIGKVNSALSTYKLLKAISPEMVINSGVAGGAGLPIGNILLADRVAYSDVWCGTWHTIWRSRRVSPILSNFIESLGIERKRMSL